MPRQSHFRACPLCEAICGLELQTEQSRLVAIRGDADDPFSRGHICPKGNAILDLESDPDRVRQPLRRRGNDWEPIRWDEAFALAGERLAAVQREHGANAVAAYAGNPNVHHFGHVAYLPALLRVLKSGNVFSASSVDQWPHQFVAAQMYGHQFLLPIPDLDHTDYFLMLGANPVASMGSLMTAPDITQRLKALVRRGRLVVIDPRRTETAQIASEHLAIRPGSDAYFLAALLQSVAAQSAPRLEHYRGALRDLDAALAAARAVDIDQAAARCGIARATIERIAAEFVAAKRAVVYGRMGVSTQALGSVCQWLMQLINLYTGNLDRVGGALPNDAAAPLTGPGTSPGHFARWHSRVRGLPEFGGELPVAALVEELTTPGAGQVRALLTSASNPALSPHNGRALEAALGQLDFMVSIDIYVNETTRFADLILPPASPLTQPHYDLVFNALAIRRVARWSAPVYAMAADERADWQIFNGLAAAYAAAAGKSFTPMPEPAQVLAAALQRGDSGLTVADLQAAPHGLDLGPLRPNLLQRLQTSSGQIECAPPQLLAELQRLAQTPAVAADDGSLLLVGRREIRSNNSWMHNAPRLAKGKPRHHLMMHPHDLAARGLSAGTRVRLRSRIGSIDIDVQASEDVMCGVVSLPHGYGHDRSGVRLTRARALAGTSYNDLTDPLALDTVTGNAALNGLPVWVEPLPVAS